MYLFIYLLASLGFSYLGNFIAAVLLEDGVSCRISGFHSLEKDVQLQGDFFFLTLFLILPSLAAFKTQVCIETHGLTEDIMSLEKENSVMKNSTCRYNVKERKF